METFTVSAAAISNLLMGGFFLFLAVRVYYSQEKQSRSVGTVIFPLVLCIALLATAVLLSLGVLTEGWANAGVNVVVCFLFLVGSLSGQIDQRPGPPGTQAAYIVTYGIVALLLIALCYVSVQDACRH